MHAYPTPISYIHIPPRILLHIRSPYPTPQSHADARDSMLLSQPPPSPAESPLTHPIPCESLPRLPFSARLPPASHAMAVCTRDASRCRQAQFSEGRDLPCAVAAVTTAPLTKCVCKGVRAHRYSLSFVPCLPPSHLRVSPSTSPPPPSSFLLFILSSAPFPSPLLLVFHHF